MNLSKSYEFFKPDMLEERIHIIGCGAIGSTVAENLVRFGITNIALYDFDRVEAHNIANQMFRDTDIGKFKVDALAEMLTEINPDCKENLKLVHEGWTGQKLAGYVFLCVDNIDLRREIATKFKGSEYIKGMFDFRMRLTDAQHYAAEWDSERWVNSFLASMDFSHEEAKESTPVSACNIPLSVCPTVRMIVAAGVANFINYVKNGEIKHQISLDAFKFEIEAF